MKTDKPSKEQAPKRPRKNRKVEFPSIKAVANGIAELIAKETNTDVALVRAKIQEQFDLLDEIREIMQRDIQNFHPALAYEMASKFTCNDSTPNSLQQIAQESQKLELHANEFYTVFDVEAKEYVIVDPKVKELLGIEPEQFSQRALLGFDPNSPLPFYPDLPHSIRCGTMAYLVLVIPGLEWKSKRDYFRTCFKVNVDFSTNEAIRASKFATLEKKAYISRVPKDNGTAIATRILYTWSVFDVNDYSGNRPYFSSDPMQSLLRNAMWYILNAYLLELDTKFLCMLHEKSENDRNKEVATQLNNNILLYTGIEAAFDEHQVSDCYSKTIRNKVEGTVGIWEKKDSSFGIFSDQEAIYHAKRLGVLPIPPKVVEVMYSGVIDIT